ncbi:unnamed protein product [Ectocarpus sp. CCAP 1310/34]|nr:unnamed protein product [Ectocarpus sp. CCAP 1310/34]
MPTPCTPLLSLVPARAPLQMITYPSCVIAPCPARRVSWSPITSQSVAAQICMTVITLWPMGFLPL